MMVQIQIYSCTRYIQSKRSGLDKLNFVSAFDLLLPNGSSVNMSGPSWMSPGPFFGVQLLVKNENNPKSHTIVFADIYSNLHLGRNNVIGICIHMILKKTDTGPNSYSLLAIQIIFGITSHQFKWL